MNSPPLNAIRVFVTAARLLSFQRAAAELFVTPGAVSRQIQALEAHLGALLFVRRHRAIALTVLGECYLAQCGPALSVIDAASRHVRDLTQGEAAPGRTVVRVDATPTFAMHWLIPRLAEFRAQHPRIDIQLGTSQGPIMRARGIDLHIRRDPAHFDGLPAEPFMSEYAVLVCSPLLPDRARLNSPAAVLANPLVRMRSRPDLWSKWFTHYGLQEKQAARRVVFIDFDNTILAIQAVVEGLGVGLIPELFASGLLQGGALIELPGTRSFESGTYHLLHGRQEASMEMEIFRQWLKLGAAA